MTAYFTEHTGKKDIIGQVMTSYMPLDERHAKLRVACIGNR